MTSSCRDNARRYLRSRFTGADGILELWECFVEQCPEIDLVADALDRLAGFHDYHRQPGTDTPDRLSPNFSYTHAREKVRES